MGLNSDSATIGSFDYVVGHWVGNIVVITRAVTCADGRTQMGDGSGRSRGVVGGGSSLEKIRGVQNGFFHDETSKYYNEITN